MADQQVAPPNDSEIGRTKATSKNGVAFEYGMLESDTNQSQPAETLLGDFLPVQWPVGNDEWKDTPSIPGMLRYRLYEIPGLFHFELDFTNDINYNFRFRDEDYDEYLVTTLRHGEHTLRYNSNKPTIIAVRSS